MFWGYRYSRDNFTHNATTQACPPIFYKSLYVVLKENRGGGGFSSSGTDGQNLCHWLTLCYSDRTILSYKESARFTETTLVFKTLLVSMHNYHLFLQLCDFADFQKSL